MQQVEQEIRASSGRKPREETHARRCGKCGETGHKCQIVVETSSERAGDERGGVSISRDLPGSMDLKYPLLLQVPRIM